MPPPVSAPRAPSVPTSARAAERRAKGTDTSGDSAERGPSTSERLRTQSTPVDRLRDSAPENPRQADGPGGDGPPAPANPRQADRPDGGTRPDALGGPENPRQADGAAPSAAERADTGGFVGERRDLFEMVAAPTAAEFDDLVDEGSINDDGRQTRFFVTEPRPGDGVLVTEFVIQEESSGPLSGDGRPLTDDPLGEDLPLDASRVIVLVDRETGRGVVTISDSEFANGVGPRVDARPIEFPGDPSRDNPFLPDFLEIPNNRISIDAGPDHVRIDYDVINSITAPTQVISVDGPIVLERGADGHLEVGAEHSPDLYPAVAVTQYLPNGERRTPYFEEGTNVYQGATPDFVNRYLEGTEAIWNEVDEGFLETSGELVEGGEEIEREVAEASREIGEADGAFDTAFEIGEASFEIGREGVEAGVETTREIAEAGIEVGREVLDWRPWRN